MRFQSVLVAPVLALLMVVQSACDAGPARPPADARERAYRINNRGHALLERFEYAPAAEAFRQALAVDSTLAIARFNLSLALLYGQDLTGASREATEAVRLMPLAPQPHYVLGLIARAENRTDDALSEFGKVLAIDPGDVGTNVNLGQIYLEQRKYPEAIAALRPTTAVEPYNVSASYNLGLALTRGGAPDGPTVLANAQTLRTTGYATTYGTGYLEQGRYAEAIMSTGREAGLVDTAVPNIAFTPGAIGVAEASSAPTSPFSRRFTAADLSASGRRALVAGLGGCLTLIDVDDDGALDVFTATSAGERLYRNGRQSGWSDISAAEGLTGPPPGAIAVACVAGDYDNDGRVDLLVIRDGGSSLYHNDGGRFHDASREARLPTYPFLPGAAAFVDVDHDGDLDIVVAGLADLEATRRAAGTTSLAFPADFAPAPVVLWRNEGMGAFADATRAAGLGVLTRAVAIVPTDFDNHRDVDLMVVGAAWPPMLFQNQRDGTFKDVAAAVGLSRLGGAPAPVRAVAAGDVNKDDAPDFLFVGDGGGVFAMSDGRGRFTSVAAPDGVRGAVAAQLVDYDNDGLLDLLSWSSSAFSVLRSTGEQWMDVSARTAPAAGRAVMPVSPRNIAVADLDGDLAPDLVVGGATLSAWRSSGTADRRALSVRLRGRNSNRLGIGAKLEVRAGALRARVETSAASPPVAAADVIFGFGVRPGGDAIRVLWPSGTLQAELGADSAGNLLTSPLVIEELDRKPSSCPFLFTWNGERFEFITDFMGGGEMGYLEAPGVRNVPNPIEYVRIPADRLQPKDGRLELRITNELEESLFADRVALLSVPHPRSVEVYPNEGMSTPPKPAGLFAVSGARVPRATDEHGHDVTDRIARVDRRYPDDFAVERFRGYARPHYLALDLAPVPARPVLLLTAWTDYAFSSDNVAAQQARLMLTTPALEVRDTSGRWRTAIADIGIPVGRPQTVTVDLTHVLGPGEHEVRVATNMKIFWDQVRVGALLDSGLLRQHTMRPLTAMLRERGFSAEVRPDGQDPPGYDYARVTSESPWKTMVGRYTRVGDVRPLLEEADDMFVIARPGDEIALSFEAPLETLPPDWTRTYVVVSDGYSKEMDINSASPDRVEPLPFHRMTGYPYGPGEHYPETDAHQRYRETYNTRAVMRELTPLAAR